jgi:hypothetical protein
LSGLGLTNQKRNTTMAEGRSLFNLQLKKIEELKVRITQDGFQQPY